jgi:serine/threonine protein kinase
MTEEARSEPDSLSLSVANRIDEACDRFEAAWKAGRRPAIEDALAAAPETERPALLRALLALEVELRCNNGDKPAPDNYERRFPDRRELIRAVFAEAQSVGYDSGSAAEPSMVPPSRVPCESEPEEYERNQFSAEPRSPLPDRTRKEASRIAGFAALSKFEILGEVGRGGMGVVYRARHKVLGKHVAIKVLLPGGSSQRFLREAKLLATVNSPHVVAVHDFDVLPDQSSMLCMDWIEGQNLLQAMRARGGRLEEDVALPWMRQVCEGMAAAAEKGIVHRDLKPSNILIDTHGLARVADFGLARGPDASSNLSRPGDVLGTPYYMAPEQAEDPPSADTRADIYSFGATFYHALTGYLPFLGSTYFSVLFKHKTEPLVPPKTRNPQLSKRLSECLERCLAKSPNERFATFDALLADLKLPITAASPWDVLDDPEVSRYLEHYRSRREIYLRGGPQRLLEADTYRFPQQRVIMIGFGNLVEQAADALVSSDDEMLSMGGGVSGALNRAAGPTLAEEARRYVPVRPGRVVVTSAGALQARFVFHAVTMGQREAEWVLPSRDLISEIMESCFYHADTLGLKSLAFPLLGTGAGGFPRDVCLDTMFRFLARKFLHGLTTVRLVDIILFPVISKRRRRQWPLRE